MHSRHIFFVAITSSIFVLSACSDRSTKSSTHSSHRNSSVTLSVVTGSDGRAQAAVSLGDPLGLSVGETTSANKNNTVITRARARGLSTNVTGINNTSLPSREVYYLNGAVDSYVEYTYQNTTRVRRAWYSGAGPDTIWFTPDDLVSSYTSYVSDQPGVTLVSYNASGPDGLWFTTDDAITRYVKTLVDAGGATVGEATYNLVGTDGNWYTADDVIAWVTSSGTSPNGEPYWALYVDAGPDVDWTTTMDNGKGHYSLKNLDAAGNPKKHILFASAGLDNALFTPDDPIIYYHTYEYNAQNILTRSILYRGGAGTDAQWFTPDDVVRSCKTVEFDANNLPYRTITYTPGLDAACFTPDDEVWGYHNDEFNPAGQVIRTVCYFAAGPDGVWFTPDDVIATEETYLAQ